jgi:hypothetical protein
MQEQKHKCHTHILWIYPKNHNVETDL